MLDARDLPDGQRLSTGICIVGAGAAGITLAREFVGTGIDVLLIESGDLRYDRDAQDLNAGSSVDPRLHGPPETHRQRRFGGSMNEQETRCAPLAAVDFEARSHVPNSGWPFGPELLAPFYVRALALCESEESARTAERDRELARGALIEGFDGLDFSTDTLDHYGHGVNFGERFADTLHGAGNICVILNATVTRLQLNAAGNLVESLIFRTLTGKAITVSATRFVIAAGAMETARLLLANRDVHPEGIGNDRDVVGRYYMCAPAGRIGRLEFARPPAAIWYGNPRTPPGVRSRRRLVLKAESQRRLQVGNFAARLVATGGANSSAPAHGLLAPLLPWRRGRTRFTLDFEAEQQANPSSRITLGPEQDALGMPRLVVDWHCNVADFETVRIGLATMASDLARSNAGRFDYEASAVASMMTCNGPNGGHHLGTARMGDDPRVSVVDSSGRVHGVENLYLAGGAVFPSSGLGDPMLTLVALSLRLADAIKLREYQAAQPKPQDPRRLHVGASHAAPAPTSAPGA